MIKQRPFLRVVIIFGFSCGAGLVGYWLYGATGENGHSHAPVSTVVDFAQTSFSVPEALASIRLDMESNPELMIECHDRVHVVGHMAYEYLQEDAYQYADPMCGGGYLHGVLEKAFAINGLNYLDTVVHASCDGEVTESCLHGVGHGIQLLTMDVSQSIQVCEQIGTEDLVCYDGVFMEQFEGAPLVVGATVPESILNLCVESPLSAQKSCYFYLPRILGQAPAISIVELCEERLTSEDSLVCAQGSGVFFMKQTSGFNARVAKNYCDLYQAEVLVNSCLRGVKAYESYGALQNNRWH
jgi:hypothetical protein